MSRRQDGELGQAAVRPRLFLVRLALIIVILGVPILGISGYFVRQVTADIRAATSEEQTLLSFEPVARLFPLIEQLHRRVPATARSRWLRRRNEIDRSAEMAQQRLSQDGYASDTIGATWTRWRVAWAAVRDAPSPRTLDALAGKLIDVNMQMEIDSPLEFDPSTAIQDLAEVILRENAREDFALRQTVDAMVLPAQPALRRDTVVAIATDQALAYEPLTVERNDLADAMSLEPQVAALLRSPASLSESRTRAFRRLVATILKTNSLSSAGAAGVERSARAALDAHQRLALLARRVTETLVLQRLERLIVRRRVLIACSLVSFAIATIGMILIGRDMARRDKMEVIAAKLEGEKLRAELANVSIERALRLQEEQFRTIFDNTDLGIVIFNEHAQVAQYNAAVEAILGPLAKPILSAQQTEIARFDTPSCAPFTIEKQIFFEDGGARWLAFRYSGQYEQDLCRMVVLLVRDVTADKVLQQQLSHAAHHDRLTRIANRAAFDEALAERIERNTNGEPFVLLYIDLDRFKPINDTYGHAGGDKVLIATAQRLVAALSSEDTCARLGGDEFAVILHHTCSDSTLRAIAERILKSIATPVPFGEVNLHVTASIGIAVSSPVHPAGTIAEQADSALYKAKEAGRNRCCIFERTPSVASAAGR